ncbi:MAG: hypothetical protein COC19_07090 [SAR86 cluster bacterium]|uniref:Cytochrome c domain-containing protein n=1 Tax=SAR86 cluster bacterium TaxID=2030880 RepID=A0A2A4MI56_9GAMM|nr:MAG: hypothetical protein COC19_07090 [SAR86 cluster bacterium]
MKAQHLAALLLAMLISSPSAFAAPSRVADFALLDNHGVFHQLSRYLHKEALVLMAYSPNCADMDSMLQQFELLQSRWQTQNISFLLIDSSGMGRAELNKITAKIAILNDETQLVSESLDINHAGEVLVFKPSRKALLYKGPLQEKEQGQEQLQQILTDSITDAVKDTVRIDSRGCDIDFPVRDNHRTNTPDYATEVAPIIIENCAECHRQEGVGPFAIDSHIMLLGWSPMIREVLLNKRMPPTQIDPFIGHSPDARYLTTQELQTLVHWIDAGGPRGTEVEDPLEQLVFDNRRQWQLGEPDYIVTPPANDVPSTGVLDYKYVNIELGFEQDRWLRAAQYLAGDESVLHHLMTYVTAPEENFYSGEDHNSVITRRFLAGYAPGKISAVVYPEDTGVFIPAGYQLSMQFHYVTNGRSTIDQSQLGLYFHDQPPAHEYLTHVLSPRFHIPAESADHEVSQEYSFDTDVVITGLRAHMHFRGKRMKFSVQQNDGNWHDLLSIPAYNYGWQPHYQLEQSAFLKAGTKVRVSGAFDNSESNPSNPDPRKEIDFGLESWNEMFTGYFSFYRP